MATNKVILGEEVLIDLTADTVTADKMLKNYTAHDKSGAVITGTCTFDADTQDATAAVAEILQNKTAYVRGSKLTGTMTNNGSVTGTISTKAGQYTVPQGYHDGGGKVGISSGEQAKIIAGNIKSGIQILGVTGTYSGEAITAQTKSVTPDLTGFQVTADAGYDYLAQVNVAAVPVTRVDNAAGGKTVTICGA